MAQENGKLVFRWHFLIIYLLIAAVISYELVDYKTERDAPSTTATTTAYDEVKVTEEADDGFDVDDDSEEDSEFVEPGTIQEYISEEESTTDESTTEKESETTKKETTKKETTKKTTTKKETTKKATTTEKKTTTTKVTTTAKPTTTKATTTTTKATTAKPTTTKAEITTATSEEPATVAEG